MSKKLETDIEQLKQQVELLSTRLDSIARIILMQAEKQGIGPSHEDVDQTGNGKNGEVGD